MNIRAHLAKYDWYRKHQEWLADNTQGKQANLTWADLIDANLAGANLAETAISKSRFNQKIISVSGIGSCKRTTIFNADENIVFCGCFKGSLEEFETEVKTIYDDISSIYRKEYENAIQYFKNYLQLKEER